MKRTLTLIYLISLALCFVQAQTDKVVKEMPFYFEMGIGSGNNGKSFMPFNYDLRAIYQATSKFSIYLDCEGQYFLPKQGFTENYNYNLGLGGGIGYSLGLINTEKPSVIEARLGVLVSPQTNYYKNTKYKLGLYWHPISNKRALLPVVGAGWSLYDFPSMGTSNMLYCSFGLRF